VKDTRKAEEIAVNRHKIIAPIMAAMEEHADAAKIVLLKKEACEQNGISRRTLGRWLDAYQQYGFEGIKPVGREGIAQVRFLTSNHSGSTVKLQRTRCQIRTE